MKKSLFTAVFISLVCSVSAQELQFDSLLNTWIYRGIIKVYSISSDKLFERANQWIARTYRSANDVIQYSSKEEGKIIAKGNWPHTFWKQGHTLTLEVKDGKLRYTFSDFEFIPNENPNARTSGNKMLSNKSNRKKFAKDCEQSALNLENGLLVESKSGEW